MNHETENAVPPEAGAAHSVEMPASVVWPLVLALGLTMVASGLVTHFTLSIAGAFLFVVGTVGWMRELFPGRGHIHEPFEPERRYQPPEPRPGSVQQLKEGMPGYRFRLPEKIHPYSAGMKGGIFGGIAMAVVAIAYGLISKHGIWYPINLLAGMVIELPTVLHHETGAVILNTAALEKFDLGWFLLGLIIHVVGSISVGMMYGVVLPTLPYRPLLWGGIIAPMIWSGALYAFMGLLNPAMRSHVDWVSFVIAQFAFGFTVDIVVLRTERVAIAPRGKGTATMSSIELPEEGQS